MRRLSVVAVLLGCLVFVACTTGEDGRIKDQIRVSLEKQNMKEVDVKVEKGVVTLEGKVATDSERAEAEHTARSVAGVTEVVNKIEPEAEPVSAAASPWDTYENTPDGWITFKTKMALFADNRTSGYETDVTTAEGNVVLSGKVDDTVAKMAATEVAKGIEGVRAVENNLQIVPESRRKMVDEKDEVIADNLKATLSPMEKDATDLEADVNNGVVTLKGTAQNRSVLSSAVRAASQVPGVKAIKVSLVEIKEAEPPRQSAGNYGK
jgi:hyperosmotically inducible protein